MARIRDLGISAIPGTMRPLEIGPGAAYEIQDAQATPYRLGCTPEPSCEFCVCQGVSNREETSLACDGATGCGHPSNKPVQSGYDASGFTLESVAEVKRQLRTRRTELDH
jgi:hypothetical protein